MSPATSSSRLYIFGLFCLALIVRFAYLYEISHFSLFNYFILDAEFHDKWALSISAGNVLGDSAFFRAPLYPYILGFIYWIFGHGYLAPRIFQHVLGAAGVVLLYLLARRIFGHRNAAIASALYALYPVVFYIEDQLLVESILNTEVLLLFTFVPYGGEKAGSLRWTYAGLMLGLVCVTRPTFLPLAPLFLWYIWWTHRPAPGVRNIAIPALSFIGGVALVILPVTARNYFVGNDAVLIASQGGINFYIGNNPGANGYSSMLPTDSQLRWEYREIVYPVALKLGHTPKPSDISSYWYAQGLHYIFDQPVPFLQLLGKKFYLFWNRFEIPNNQSFYSFAEHSILLQWLPIGFWLVGPLGMLGMVFAWKKREARLWVLFVLAYCLIVIAFFVCDRFRLPVLPFLCIFSAVSITTCWDDFTHKNYRSVARAIAMLCIFAVFTNSNTFGFKEESRKVDLLHLGNAALEQNRLEEAITYFDQSAKEPERLQDVHLNRGVANWKLNRQDQALADFRRELRDFPRSYEAWTNIAHLYLIRGVSESTLVYAAAAIRMKPYASTAYIDLAMAYINYGEPARAESVLVEGRRNCEPDFIYGESVLAGIHQSQGKGDQAEREYRDILSRLRENAQPDYRPEFRFAGDVQAAEKPNVVRAKIFYGLGHIVLERGKIDSSAAYFKVATELSPDFSEAWIDLGISLRDLGNSREAEVALKRGLELGPANFVGWYYYGIVLTEKGATPGAATAFENALKANPNFSPAREALDSIRTTR